MGRKWDDTAGKRREAYDVLARYDIDLARSVTFRRNDMNEKRMPSGAERCVIVGEQWQVYFAMWMGWLDDLAEGERSAYRLSPEALDSPQPAKVVDAASVLLELADPLIDLRPGANEVIDFAPIMRDDIPNPQGIAYKGNIPRDKADHLLAGTLGNLSRRCLLQLFDWGLEIPGGAAVGEEALDALACGHERFTFRGLGGEGVAPYRWYWLPVLLPKGDAEVRERTRQLYRLSDIERIWEKAIDAALASRSIGEGELVLFPYKQPRKDLFDVIEKVQEKTGVAAMVDAYYDGVPVEDIIA